MSLPTNIEFLLAMTGLILLTSCGSGSNNSLNTRSIELLPLKLSIKDLSNNSIQFVDIYKIGSHTQYKLVITNPNAVAITLVKNGKISLGIDLAWVDYQKSIYGESYVMAKNPNIDHITKYFTKTSNADDCFNNISIYPNKSCSFYITAVNYGTNNTNQDVFSFPIQYSIYQTDNPSNSLTIRQCAYQVESGKFDCYNANQTVFRAQFINYRTIHINGTAPEAIFHSWNGYSKNGKYLYMCDNNYTGLNCRKYPLSYDLINNKLIIGVSELSFKLPSNYGPRYLAPLVNSNGGTAWYVFYSGFTGYYIVNSNQPGTFYKIPNINNTIPGYYGGVMGADDSYWWNTNSRYNSSRYDEITNSFVETNIPFVAGVVLDGIVIGLDGRLLAQNR